jgi:hypothetical protein
MRLLSLAIILTLAPAMVFAQRGGGHAGGGGGGARSAGSMGGGGMRSAPSVSRGFSGGGAVRGSVGVGGAFRGGTFGGVNRGFNGGFRGPGFVGNRFFGGFGFGFGYPYWGYGWGYPYYGYGAGYYGAYDPYDYGYGSSYGYSDPGSYYGDGYYGGSNYGYGAPPQVNQNYAPPMPPSGGSQADSYYRRPDYYLIAFSDHSIQAVTSYHVDGDQLYYTTRDNVERHVSLSSVDRRFSEQLNRDRRVQFQLPQ